MDLNWFILGGVVNYGVAALYFCRSCRRVSKWISAEGRVVEMESSEDGFAAPIVQFVTTDKQRHTFTNGIAATWYHVGQKVRVMYNPHDPQHAAIDDVTSLWGIPIIGIAVGTVFWLLSCINW